MENRLVEGTRIQNTEAGERETESTQFSPAFSNWSRIGSGIGSKYRRNWLVQANWFYFFEGLRYHWWMKLRLQIIELTTRIVFCTVDTSHKAQRPLITGRHEFWNAIILDEAGCVPEWKMPALTIFDPTYLIMVGDHHQLPPFTNLPQNQWRVVSILEVSTKTSL